MNGWIRVHITERPIGLPLCSLSRKIKGLMFSKPVHDKIFAKKILELLDIAKLMANEHQENLPLSNGLNIPASGAEKPFYLVVEVALEQSVIITMVGTCCDPSASLRCSCWRKASTFAAVFSPGP